MHFQLGVGTFSYNRLRSPVKTETRQHEMVVSAAVCLSDGFLNLHCSDWAVLRPKDNAHVRPSFRPEFRVKFTHYVASLFLRSFGSIALRISSCFLVTVTTRAIWSLRLESRR